MQQLRWKSVLVFLFLFSFILFSSLWTKINSVQTRCIVKGEALKSPLFWRFSRGCWFSQDRLFSRNSTRKPLNLIKSWIFTNTPCKSTCLYNALSMHTVDKTVVKPLNSKKKSWRKNAEKLWKKCENVVKKCQSVKKCRDVGAGKKPINKKTHKQNFHGTVPGLSRPLPEISWEFCLCVSLFPGEKGKHINNLTPTQFRDNPAKLLMFIGFFSPLRRFCPLVVVL